MTRGDDAEEMTVGQMLQNARRTYLALHLALTERVEAFAWVKVEQGRDERAKAEAAEGDAKARAEGLEREKLLQAEINALQKSLEVVMDCERKLERIISERAGRRSGDVDFDAARREILGELARLAERG